MRGLKMLAEDIQAGRGNVRIRQSDARAFKLGVNLAATPGKVIFRNPLIELIQYEPSTNEVYKRPLLIVPRRSAIASAGRCSRRRSAHGFGRRRPHRQRDLLRRHDH